MTSLDRIAGNLSGVSNDFAHLNELAAHHTALISDDHWRWKVDIVLSLMTTHAEEILALDAPSTMGSIHVDFSKMALEIQIFAALYAEGIEDADAAQIQSALSHLAEVDRWAAEGTQQMESLCRDGRRGEMG